MKLKIGDIMLENPVILAPMAGVTDLPFRRICKEQGVGLLCMEMVSANAIHYRSKNTEELMLIDAAERPVSLQLFGSDPERMAEAAKRIEEKPFSLLDINMGCPVPKVVNNGEGSALLQNPVLAGKIIESVVKAIDKPVTVKIRRGFDEEHLNYLEMARIAEESGASAITVHGRTRQQYYAGKADWTCIREIKETVRIPVIGNGDIVDAASAKAMLEETGCDGIMVGRAAQGNPWIFREILSYLRTGSIPKRPSLAEMKEVIKRHAKLQLAVKGEYIGVREMRKHLAWYTAGMPHSAGFRQMINTMESMDELLCGVERIFG